MSPRVTAQQLRDAQARSRLSGRGVAEELGLTVEQTAIALPARRHRGWSNAVRTACSEGHTHPSKLEARTCDRLHHEYSCVDGARVWRLWSFPLPNLAPTKGGGPHWFNPDFVITVHGRIVRVVDSKGRRSPEWTRGKAAFDGAYAPLVCEEVCA